MARPASVATETLAYCTSCKMDLNHVIVAMKGDRIAKVQCLTCKKDHVYRAPKGATEPKVKTVKTKKSDTEDTNHSLSVEWEKLMAAHKDLPLKPYSTRGQFVLGDKLKHPTFGEGIVGKLIYPNKIEVIFKTDVKVLIYAGTPAEIG
ncbi:MAG: hypothetical protein ACO3A2_03385 [Bdellovibrionia bacterium]